MGYTHYWKFKNGKKPINCENGAEKFKNAVALFKEGLALLNGKTKVVRYNAHTNTESLSEDFVDMKICGGNGKGEPTITDTRVIFNGTNENDLSHETFFIDLNEPCAFEFCKTAHKPYDTAVCLALLCFKHYFGEDFEFSSDGDIDGVHWEYPKQIFKEIK